MADLFVVGVDPAETSKRAARTAAILAAPTAPRITTSSALGKPHEVIVEEAERRGATLIVVGNRGMQGFGRVLGSVANSVAHQAPCDVYIVKTV